MTEAAVRALYAQGEEAVVAAFLELQQQVSVLGTRLAELEARANKNSRNSHKPPSSDGYGKPPSPTRQQQNAAGRQTGGQPGHRGSRLEMASQPDHTQPMWPEVCEKCGTGLASEGQREGQVVARGQVFELPPVRLEVTEYQVMEQVCPDCGGRCRGRLPEGVVPGTQYGSRMKAAMTYLQVQQLLPLERASELLEDLLGAAVSEATIADALTTGATGLAPVLTQIKQGIVDSAVGHFDETGMRVAGRLQWLHTGSTEDLTYYTMDPKRGRAAHERIGILPVYRGTAVHDGLESYEGYACDHALCNAHHLRELDAIAENPNQPWASDLAGLLRQAQHWKKHGKLTEARQARTRKRYDALVKAGRHANLFDLAGFKARPSNGRVKRTPAQNLLVRLAEHKDDVLRFMSDPDVPFDNNLAERDLRMMKVKQKVSGCFRTEEGARIFCAIRSYISTVRKQGIGVLEALTSVFDRSPILPQLPRPPG